MEEGDTLTTVLTEIGFALEPLATALESVNNFQAYALELGWPLSSIPQVIQDIGAPLRVLSARLSEGTLDSSAIPEVVQLLRGVIEAIHAIETAPPGQLPPLVGFATEFPQQMLDRTIIDYLTYNYPIISNLLLLAGVFERKPVPAAGGRTAYISRKVNWSAIGGLFQNPLATLDAAYSWHAAFQVDYFMANLRSLLYSWGLFLRSGGVDQTVAQSLFGTVPPEGVAALIVQIVGDRFTNGGLGFGVLVAPTPGSPGIGLIPYANGGVGARFNISDNYALTIQGETTFEGGFAILISPTQGIRFLQPTSGAAASLDTAAIIGLEVQSSTGASRLLFGSPEGSRFEYQSASARAGGQFSTNHAPIAMIEASLKGGRIVISLGGADNFLSAILPADGLAFDVDLTVGFNSASGLYFGGSAGLEVQLPAHVSLGPIEIQSALLALKLKDGKFVNEIGATIKGDLAVLKATIENMGLRAVLKFASDGRGNLGPLDLGFEFKPPNGVGLAIDAGVVKGGGFLYLDFDKGEYAGALELTISDFLSLKAIGLIDTKLPGGQPGFSLLIIITAEFNPGFQLGFGFTLIGVGGLLGLNRSLLLDPLAQGVRTGAVNSILFPTNVVENAPKIISDLRSIFPPQQGIFLIGPMAKIGWGTPTLISVSIGVIIEIPGNVVILGRLLVALPDPDDAVLVLQLTFIGALEFDKRRIWFFASLYESRLLFISLDGEMGLLMDYSDNPNFVLSVGGFHPRFSPPPLPFPSPKRITLSIVNESWARIGAETYFAVTSNTVQMGVSAQAFFGYDSLSLEGYFSFDALLRFSPFYLIVDLSAGFSVKVFGVGVFGIRLSGSLEGPTPWHIHGSAEIDLLFFSISVAVDATFGEQQADTLPPIEVLPKLQAEFEKLESWRATLPASGLLFVSLRDLGSSGVLVLHPVGTLQISQRFAPLNIPLDKIGNQKLSDIKRAWVSVTAGALTVKGPTRENFAAAQYRDMDDAAKLSAPSFEKLESGVEIGATGQPWTSGPAAQRNVRYEQIIIDTAFERYQRRFFKFWDGLFSHFRAGGAVSRSSISQAAQKRMQPFDSKVVIADEQFTVAYQADNRAYTSTAIFFSYAEAQAHMDGVLQQDPSLTDEIHVIPFAEVNQAT